MTPTLGTSRRRLAALLLVCVAVALAGCAGWGTDGPANDSDASNTSSDDLEDEQNNDSSNADSDGSDATNESDSTADGEESDDGPPDDGEDDSSDGDSVDDPSETDESDGEDTSDGSEDGSEERTDEDTESEQDGADDSDTDTDETPDDESPSEQPPADENSDENSSDENSTNENASDDPETYTLTVEAEGPVTIERVSDGATTTREATDGTVEFTVLEGDYEIRAEQEEYVDPMLSVGVTEDTTITLQRGGSITYTVIDAETGEPIEGAEISGMCDLWYSSGDASISGESNASGVIEAETLTPTTCRYDTQITAEGYEPTSLGEIDVPEDDGTTVELQPEESQSTATLAFGGPDGTASMART